MRALFQRVQEVVVEQLNVDEEQVTEEAAFMDDLGADSLDIVELVMALETEFDIKLSDEDVKKIHTVGDAVAYIQEHAK